MPAKKSLAESAVESHQRGLELLYIDDTCDVLNMSEGAVRRLIRDGVIPVVKIGGKKKSRIRVRRADLDALIAANYHPATSGPLAEHS